MQAPSAVAAPRALEVAHDALALGLRDRTPEERAQHHILREDHRAPHHLALEAAVWPLQRLQLVGGRGEAT